MDWQPLINLAATTALGIAAWFIKGVKDEMRSTADALTKFQLEVAKEYVTHNDLGDIKDSLRRIEDKLDNKQDK